MSHTHANDVFFKIKSTLNSNDPSNYYKILSPAELIETLSAITEYAKNIFDNDSELSLIYKKAVKRLEVIDFDSDHKVPPGSNNVMRSYRDKRFVLCCLSLFQSQVICVVI
jgi:hypothetical protein